MFEDYSLIRILGKISLFMVPVACTWYYVAEEISDQKRIINKKPNIFHRLSLAKKQEKYEIGSVVFAAIIIFILTFIFNLYILVLWMTFYFTSKFHDFGEKYRFGCLLTFFGFLLGIVLSTTLAIAGKGEHIMGKIMFGPWYNIMRIADFFDKAKQFLFG